ncbi:YqhG family protein [Paenibacillus koleovorans]|uniref:YqhG family protein n=1 Tax=Paenibacillus koleovorans TaxID=121608 RepID=UPI000FD86385|nr:YqhG family protein [Paenibacillus koleovorans]
MNTKQIQKFFIRYLETTDCHIIEKSPAHVTVKLSSEADRSLSNRPFYWSFIDRMGTPPETMTFKFVFDPEKHRAEEERRAAAAPQASSPKKEPESILERYFGITPPLTGPGRIAQDEVTFGSRRLEQLFQVVRSNGKFVQLFEEPGTAVARGAFTTSVGYTSWLAVNYKVELLCDMKRDELHSLGIDLTNGQIVTGFHDRVMTKRLTPRFPVGGIIPRQQLTITRARTMLEQYVEKLLRQVDHRWADGAHERLADELERVDGYYGELIGTVEAGKKEAVQAQWDSRRQEMEWQYRPRVQVSVINCGLFHLRDE